MVWTVVETLLLDTVLLGLYGWLQCSWNMALRILGLYGRMPCSCWNLVCALESVGLSLYGWLQCSWNYDPADLWTVWPDVVQLLELGVRAGVGRVVAVWLVAVQLEHGVDGGGRYCCWTWRICWNLVCALAAVGLMLLYLGVWRDRLSGL
jgi:hypothetical protein